MFFNYIYIYIYITDARLRKKRTVLEATLIPWIQALLMDSDVPLFFKEMWHSQNLERTTTKLFTCRPSTRREMVTERVGDRPEDIRGRSPGDGRGQ